MIEGTPGEAFPIALREIRRRIADESGLDREQIEEVEPLAADVRASRAESPRHLARMAKLRVLACVLGCRFDDLRQREQERRTRRIAVLGAAAMVLLCVMTTLTVFALIQRKTAIANAAITVEKANEALVQRKAAIASANEATANAERARPSGCGHRKSQFREQLDPLQFAPRSAMVWGDH